MKRVVAILETMWDWRAMTSGAGYRQAPPFFRINPKNYSGRRLYKLLDGQGQLLVTNACKELATSAKGHGVPNPEWLAENLKTLDGMSVKPEDQQIDGNIDLLLVCGKVAQETFKACGYRPHVARILEIPHPAARGKWTKETIRATQQSIHNIIRGNNHDDDATTN